MNVRDNKGITLITLVITVIILAILAYASVSIGISLLNTGKYTDVQTFMITIQNKCDIRLNQYIMGDIEEEELYGEKQESGNLAGTYKLSQRDLNEMGLSKANAKEGYYVAYDFDNGTVEVIYETGVENSGEIYHNLSDMI
ncbi:MAG: hypothetical protein HFJ50_07025 [Clostridia bacterium]|jgi:type II secretory pathway pseudopilin PulG|nr:hypothetical protein [Clostridia bacterium]